MNKREASRLAYIKREVGCICCRIAYERGGQNGIEPWCDAHHILQNGRRISHWHTIPLCAYHHRGVLGDKVMGGPSVSDGKKEFERYFPSELALLELVDSEIPKHLRGDK